MSFTNNRLLKNIVLGCLTLMASCSDHGSQVQYATANEIVAGDSLLKHPKGEPDPEHKPYYHLSSSDLERPLYYTDTVTAKTTEELLNYLQSNRVIRLLGKEYTFGSSLLFQNDSKVAQNDQGLVINGIKNLKIEGTVGTKLSVYSKNAPVLKLINAHNIRLESLIIGHTESPGYEGEQGALNISYSYNIRVSNCKLLGAGTFGLLTYAVYNLKFKNSEITKCTALIFELERTRNVKFKNSKFHHNTVATSVLGGFTNASEKIFFKNCDFTDNQPKMDGNPLFNQMDNYEPILFSNCTFKNNKGFKWYGDQLELVNCQIDSSDFIGLY